MDKTNTKMKKYIFLDFDGVINTQNDEFDKNAVANLRRLLERTDAKIIISSTWRLQGMEYIQQLWQEYHLSGEVIGLTPSCNSINFSNVDGQEEWQGLHGCKGLEIAEWLRLNAK
ncbi:HAD domain-containing protein, partial [uncultured Prevotella sp.]|uniref:HAD domain-containing protein n=1 Tax=uncultured Prevotella sp. TaxID=159272 RepID=UPI002607B81F